MFGLKLGFSICLITGSPVWIDVNFQSDGQPFIADIVVPGLNLTAESHDHISLSLVRSSRIHVGIRDAVVEELFTGVILTRDLLPLCPLENPAIKSYGYQDPSLIIVAIGPDSVLQSTYGTINFIRYNSTNARMILGGRIEEFSRSCVSNSTIRVNHTASRNYNLRMHFQLSWPGWVETSEPDLPVIVTGGSHLMTIPAGLASLISETILASGAHWYGTERFRRCNKHEVIHRLPVLSVGFGSTLSTLVLSPEDYMGFNTDEGSCWYRFGITYINSNSIIFNPLVINDTNIHITDDSIWICDAVY